MIPDSWMFKNEKRPISVVQTPKNVSGPTSPHNSKADAEEQIEVRVKDKESITTHNLSAVATSTALG